MKRIVIMFIVALLSPQLVQAQETIYSNLNDPSTGSWSIGSDSWLATQFETGNNADGYILNSIQLAMTGVTGTPNGFTVMFYAEANNPSAVLPGTSLGTLNGSSDPSTADVYTYTPLANLILLPGTFYFVVVTAGTTTANGAYEWSETASFVTGNGGGTIYGSSNGTTWNYVDGPFAQFALTATAIPEPSGYKTATNGMTFVTHLKNKSEAASRY